MLNNKKQAFKLCLAAFIVPYMFIYSPALLMEGPALGSAYATLTAVIGVAFLGSAIQGWFFGLLGTAQRLLLGTAALLFIHSGAATDSIGLGLAALTLMLSATQRNNIAAFVRRKKEPAAD